ncbi:hypothetical protein AB1L30_03530 [Bremerella sp. JC817]|uniref:hypothetical protein n=1 Tax=Bremerella sp. JC817 TaxID=3231756 RepID=UPI003457E27D
MINAQLCRIKRFLSLNFVITAPLEGGVPTTWAAAEGIAHSLSFLAIWSGVKIEPIRQSRQPDRGRSDLGRDENILNGKGKAQVFVATFSAAETVIDSSTNRSSLHGKPDRDLGDSDAKSPSNIYREPRGRP